MLFVFLTVDDAGNERSVYLHRPHGTKFLTTEAGNTPSAVDHWLIVFHVDDVSGADLSTFFASDAIAFFDTRFRAKRISDE